MRALIYMAAFATLAACDAGYVDSNDTPSQTRAPLSASVQISVDRSYTNQLGNPAATISVRNGTSQYLHIDTQCTFFDAAGAVTATGTDLVQNVAPGGTGRGEIRSYDRGASFDRVECRVERAFPSS